MEVEIERDLDAHHVVEVEEVPAGMERKQCDALRTEGPSQLSEGYRQLSRGQMDDRVEGDRAAYRAVGEIQVEHGTDPVLESRRGAPRDFDHPGRHVDPDHVTPEPVQVPRDMAWPAAQIGDRPWRRGLLEGGKECPVERLV